MNDMRSVPEPSSVGGRDPWAGFAAGPSSGSYPSPDPVFGNGSDTLGDDRAAADLARRLQDRIDGQEALLDRVALLAQLSDDRARIAELRNISRRLRRDSEALLLLCGADPGVHRGAPHTVPAVLGDAVGLADEPSRVSVTAAPSATLASTAAVELRHLVAELVDEAAAASPGARVEVDARLAPDGDCWWTWWWPVAAGRMPWAGRGPAPPRRRGSPSGSPGARRAGSGWSGR